MEMIHLNAGAVNIRSVVLEDASEIARIYNYYIENGTQTFEVDAVSEAEMSERIGLISASFPFFICDVGGKIAGYCYAHLWKQRPAYRNTLETTVYVSPEYLQRGIGRRLMEVLIEECRRRGFHVLIACITGGNSASEQLHLGLGFKRVSLFEKVGEKFGRVLDVSDFELML